MQATETIKEFFKGYSEEVQNGEKVILSWNQCDIANSLQEEDPESYPDFHSAYESIDWDITWEDFIYDLNEILKVINPNGRWYATVNNFGWRNLSGHTEFTIDDAQSFLNQILPDTDCSFKIYYDIKDNNIKIINYHHDSPMGETYYCHPIPTESMIEDFFCDTPQGKPCGFS